ncbi:hypothetical protein EDD40_2760 [Saccharothrix texasensis]|uniref:CHAD domain-containing protein n=2 Tax=Saccharothrix texasensis TaxID=103734 RepID=A0A3N1H4L1_9PSEU|nr:hypothetical protein EDD40_2760 [Saccharothrix texasensis]
MGCRARLLALNLVHRRVAEGLTSNEELLDEHLEQYRQVRAKLRQVVALLRLNGPDALVEAALRVREAERALRATRFTCDDGGRFNADVPPQAVLDAAHALEAVTHEFAATARKLA